MKEYKNELTTEELVKKINERQRVEDAGKNAIKQESQKNLYFYPVYFYL